MSSMSFCKCPINGARELEFGMEDFHEEHKGNSNFQTQSTDLK
jgi:hypothetical protein